ncbi:MAG: glutamate racemase [Lachnospiraceae bacterium]|nr:glutamate racemase [Lachnospiraceae bacterium]
MKGFIAVFDSGVGGISVLREMVRLMPNEDFLYYGDSKNAPYGTRTTEEVRALTVEHTEDFLTRGAKAVAIACNTATSAAARVLRQMHPEVPLVGIEPALKPAVEKYPTGRVLVLATPMTVREEKFLKLLNRFGGNADVIPLAAPGLMEFVERGELDSPDLRKFLMELLAVYRVGGSHQVDAVVLGCTHYPFVAQVIGEVLGDGVEIFDGSYGTAKELKRRLSEAGLANPAEHSGSVTFENSAPTKERMALCEKLMIS